MDLALGLDPRLALSWPAALDLAVQHDITYVEPSGGGFTPRTYLDPTLLASDRQALATFAKSISSRGLQIAALGCFGNPLHPDPAVAAGAHEDFLATCHIAAELGVTRIDVISGVPAGGPHDRTPNWIVPSLRPEFADAYHWQWAERAIPYWREACALAASHGLTVSMEPVAGYLVYNDQTFLRLREACGETLRASIDPSHLWWMGIDPILFVEQLADAIGYVHAKDAVLDRHAIARHGVAPACPFSDWDARTWKYRTVGFGHPQSFWNDFFAALRRHGYDDLVCIEYEESEMAAAESIAKSLAVVTHALPRDPIPHQ